MSINWGGIGDWFTGGFTDFDQQGSSNWQFNPIGGGHDAKWGPSIGTQVGNYPGSVEFVQDYARDLLSGASGTQAGVEPSTPGSSFQFSSASAPVGKFSAGDSYGSGGANKIGSWYVDPGSADMLAEAMIRQKYTPLQRTWHKESYGPGGGSGGGSSTGDAIKGLAGKAINLVGGKLLGSIF